MENNISNRNYVLKRVWMDKSKSTVDAEALRTWLEKSKFLNWLHVQYSEYYIEPSLKPFVKVIWSMENDKAIFDAIPMRILRDTC